MKTYYQRKVEALTQNLLEVIVNDTYLMNASSEYALNKLRLKYREEIALPIIEEQLECEYYELVALYQRKILKQVMKVI